MENTFTTNDESVQGEPRIPIQYPEPTIQLIMGDVTEHSIVISLVVTKGLYNRFRYWMFGKFFPFKIKWLI